MIPIMPDEYKGKWVHKRDNHCDWWDDRYDWLECPFCEYGRKAREIKCGKGPRLCPCCGASLREEWEESV